MAPFPVRAPMRDEHMGKKLMQVNPESSLKAGTLSNL
jgi:hypothetical protein